MFCLFICFFVCKLEYNLRMLALYVCNWCVCLCVCTLYLLPSPFRSAINDLFIDIYLSFFRPLTPPYQLFRCLFAQQSMISINDIGDTMETKLGVLASYTCDDYECTCAC